MSTSNRLSGVSVMILEDDFYLAEEIADILRRMGAVVMGPYPEEGEAIALIERTPPDCAVIDMNLGHGPSFEIPRMLKELSIPFILSTGYDADVIPEDLAQSPRVTKPVAAANLITALTSVLMLVDGS